MKNKAPVYYLSGKAYNLDFGTPAIQAEQNLLEGVVPVTCGVHHSNSQTWPWFDVMVLCCFGTWMTCHN